MARVWSWIELNFERWLISGFYAYFCLIILVEVLRRHVFGASSQWGEMTARYAFVFLVYVAAAEVARSRNHIRIDLVPSILGPRARLALYLYIDFLYLLLAGLVIYYSIKVLGISIRNGTLMTGLDLNMAFAQTALPIGWTLLLFRVIQRFVHTVRSYMLTGDVPLGGGGFGD
jgi:TRAP-type C4-dicarboxylate transport system permease small subunit